MNRGKGSTVFPSIRKPDLLPEFAGVKERMKEQKSFNINFQSSKFWDEVSNEGKPR